MNIKEPIRIELQDPESLHNACAAMLLETLSIPEARALIERMIADKEVTRQQLVHTAWAQGASFVLAQVMIGRVIPLRGTKN